MTFRILYHVLQWTWGIVQNIAGLALDIALGRGRRSRFYGARVIEYPRDTFLGPSTGCFTLGRFVFMNEGLSGEERERLLVHEYGHTVQSILYGPLYLAVVGIPSVLRFRRFYTKKGRKESKGTLYSSGFPENQANRLGEWATGRRAIDW